MTKEQKMVRDFHLAMKNDIPGKPVCRDNQMQVFRYKLIAEELREFVTAKDLAEVADSMGDMLYVVLGTAVEYGIDLEPIFNEIHRSNMTKFIDGYKRADGKWIKGPSYSPANLKPILKLQS